LVLNHGKKKNEGISDLLSLIPLLFMGWMMPFLTNYLKNQPFIFDSPLPIQ
jgi:hypothetical protein